MKLSTKLMALGAVAALMVSGTMLALTPSTEVSASDEAPVVTVEDSTTEAATLDMNVNVMCRVDGEGIALAGVNVTVYTVEMIEDESTTTMVIDRVAEAQTDDLGNVTFQLPEGKYVVSATYQGLRGFDWVNLTEDQASTVMLHCGDRDTGTERFQCRDGSGYGDRQHWSDNSTCCHEHNCTARDEYLVPGHDGNCTAQPYLALGWDNVGEMLN